MGSDADSFVFWGFPIEERPESFDEDDNWLLEGELPCWTDFGGCDPQPDYFVYIQASLQRGSWDAIALLKPLDTKAEWAGQLREFCVRFEIPWQEPGWHIATRWF